MRALVCVLLLMGIVGCSSKPDERCTEKREYQTSTSVSGLVVPEGLTPPKDAAGLVVPAQQAGPAPGATCLDRPPDYFRKEGSAPAKAPAPPSS